MHTISKQRRSSDEEESARLSLRSQAPESGMSYMIKKMQ